MRKWTNRPADKQLPYAVMNAPASDILVYDAVDEALDKGKDIVAKYRGRSYVVKIVAEIASFNENGEQRIEVTDWTNGSHNVIYGGGKLGASMTPEVVAALKRLK